MENKEYKWIDVEQLLKNQSKKEMKNDSLDDEENTIYLLMTRIKEKD